MALSNKMFTNFLGRVITWFSNTERPALAFTQDHFPQFHTALSVDSK